MGRAIGERQEVPFPYFRERRPHTRDTTSFLFFEKKK